VLWEKENVVAPPGIIPRFLGRPASSLVPLACALFLGLLGVNDLMSLVNFLDFFFFYIELILSLGLFEEVQR